MFHPGMRRFHPARAACALACAVLGVAAAPVAAQQGQAESSGSGADDSLRSSLSAAMRSAGRASGAYVYNATEGRRLFESRAGTPRILASNTKLFTTAAALARFEPDGTIETRLLGVGSTDEDGAFRGDLYLRGGGDPSFGSRSYVRRRYGTGATVEALASRMANRGIKRVTGRVYGDESLFDSLRGSPGTGFRTTSYLSPLSALAFNRGFATESGRSYQSSPPTFAAVRLDAALEARDIEVGRAPRIGRAPSGADELASVRSPEMARLVQITNKPSDNYFAEILLKGLAAREGKRGTTAAGAAEAVAFARGVGSRVSMADGSGISHGNRASPRNVARLLDGMRKRDTEFPAYEASLAVAGRDGTLANRMEGDPAEGRCRAKTGTVTGVSTLSGYCESRSGDTLVFSILMNSGGVTTARRIQDRMANAMARYTG